MTGDSELIALVAAGSTEAFDLLYSTHVATVGRYAWGVSSSRQSAQELVQDTFLTLWHNAGRITLMTDSALPWLLATCKNHSRNLGRAESRHSRLISTLTQRRRLAESMAEEPDAPMRWIHDAIDRLPRHEAMVVHLCLVEDMTYKDAAAVLGLSDAAVAKRLQRARTKLRKDLANEDA